MASQQIHLISNQGEKDLPFFHSLHEAILRDGWGEVQALVARGEQETVDLDFKCKTDSTTGSLDKKEREILAQALSAMANSMGGAVVYGVDCRKNADDVDEASSIKPITGIKWFAGEVRTNIPNLVLPRLDDVAVDAVMDPANPDSGILIVSVGRSERRPHRSEAAGDKRYYKRSGSNTIQMEHFDVEDSFKRLSVAKLEIEKPRLLGGGSSGDTIDCYLSFSLRNSSTISARFPFVEIEKLTGGLVWAYGIDGNYGFPLQRINRNQTATFAGDANTVVHPDQTVEVFRLVFHVHRPSRTINASEQHAFWPRGSFTPISEARVELTLRVACENAPMTRHEFLFSSTELQDLFGM